jgi:hypothetical protein
MGEELTELAATAANTLVSAIGTDLWQGAKSAMAALLPRSGGRRRELAKALDRLPEARTAQDSARQRDFWTEAIGQLLSRDPGMAEQVAALAGLAGPAAPGHAVQVNSASGSGQVYAVQHGPQFIHRTVAAYDDEEAG